MIKIFIDDVPTLHLKWDVYKTKTTVKENFDQSTFWAFLKGARNTVPLTLSLDNESYALTGDLPTTWTVGVWGLKLIWVKDATDATTVKEAVKYGKLCVTEVSNLILAQDTSEGADYTGDDEKTVHVMSNAATYGYDGLSAYEKAIILGTTTLQESDWIANLSDMNARFAEIEDEVDEWEDDETARETAEEARIANENARVTAEAERVSNENTRVSAELERGNSERTRVSNEETRVQNEQIRERAESTRKNYEQSRVDAEKERVANEKVRVSNETARVSAENKRQTNETARQNAESTRQATFNQNEAQRKVEHQECEEEHSATINSLVKKAEDILYVKDGTTSTWVSSNYIGGGNYRSEWFTVKSGERISVTDVSTYQAGNALGFVYKEGGPEGTDTYITRTSSVTNTGVDTVYAVLMPSSTEYEASEQSGSLEISSTKTIAEVVEEEVEEQNENITRIDQKVSTLDGELAEEVNRAKEAEAELSDGMKFFYSDVEFDCDTKEVSATTDAVSALHTAIGQGKIPCVKCTQGGVPIVGSVHESGSNAIFSFEHLGVIYTVTIDGSDNLTFTYYDVAAKVDNLGQEVSQKLDDAPSDGNQYARKDGAWSKVTGGGGSIDVDTEMSDTSENAVQNKVIKAYADEMAVSLEEECAALINASSINLTDSTTSTGFRAKLPKANSYYADLGSSLRTSVDCVIGGRSCYFRIGVTSTTITYYYLVYYCEDISKDWALYHIYNTVEGNVPDSVLAIFKDNLASKVTAQSDADGVTYDSTKESHTEGSVGAKLDDLDLKVGEIDKALATILGTEE